MLAFQVAASPTMMLLHLPLAAFLLNDLVLSPGMDALVKRRDHLAGWEVGGAGPLLGRQLLPLMTHPCSAPYYTEPPQPTRVGADGP